MRRSNWVWLAGAFVAIPAVVAAIAFLAWLGLVIQFTFDDCMAQQAVAADRPRMGSG
jgi:ABC-type phosphate transport system auxiliary subunit